MAEVKRGFQSLSSKKLPSFSNNGFTVSPSFASSSSSSKHIYDDVFASLPPPRRPYSSEFSGFADDDFGEIFGCSKSENGVWQSSDSTIPILNLPDSESRSTRGGGIDYSGVFGGFGDDSSALPDGEDLSNQFKKKAKTSAPDSIPRGKAEMTGSTGPHISRQCENDQRPTRGFNQSFDSVKHFEHHIEMVPNEPNRLAQVAHVHATAGSTLPSHEVGSSKETQTGRAPMMKQDAEVGIGIYLVKHGKHSRNSSEVAVSEQKNEHGGGTQKASCLSEVNSAATFHESCPATVVAAPSKLLQEGATVQSDIRDDARIAVSVPRYSSTQEVGPSQKILTNRAPMTKDNDELGVNLSLVKEMAESSRNAGSEFKKGELSKSTSSEFGAQEWKSEKDTDNHETSGLSESNSDQENIGESSKVVKDDTKVEDVACDAMDTEPSDLVANKNNGENAATFHKASSLSGSNQKSGSSEVFEEDVKSSPVSDVRKKPSRHARMTSLDLSDHTHAHQADAATLRKTRFGSSYSFDASHDPSPARIKVQPSKVVPSSSLPQFFPVENHCKISENTDYKGSENNMYRGDGDSLPSLDEQLDVNSMAAISAAAALQRALQEAELRIRLAKEFLEREGQGNGKLSFKDTLKLKAGKENNNANAMNEYRHNKLRHRQQLDSRVKTFSHIKRKSVLETAQVLPLREVQRKVPKDEEPMELRNPDVPKSVEGDDKREGGGEWEAAKHLNQLISGVKNRIASFMAWQAETEKKDEPKETETSKKTQQQSQSKQELNDAEFFEMEATEKNDYASVFAYESMPGECKTSLIPESIELNGFMQNNTAMEQDIGHEVDVPDNARKSWSQSKTGFISGVIKPDETELVESNIAAEQKAGDKYNVVCDNEGSTRTSFLFFTFSNEKSWVPNNSGGENRETEGRRELGVKNPLKEKKNEVEVDDDQMQCKNEDANQEELDHICVSQDCEKIFEGSSNGESNGTVEEPKSVHGYDGSKHAFEEDGDRRLNQKSGDDRSEFTHEDNCDSRLNEEYEYEDDRSVFTYQENRKQSEEFRGDINKFTCQKNDTLNDEYEDNRSEFDHEEDRRMNENCRDDRGESSYQEDKRLSEECADNCSDFIHNEGIMPSDEHEGNLSNFSHEENNDNRQSENFGSDQSNFTHGEIGDIKVNEDCDEEPMNTSDCCETFAMTIVTDYEREEYKEIEDAEDQLDDREQLEEANLVHDLERSTEVIEELDEKQENEKDQGLDKNAEELSQQMNGWEENNIQANRTVEKKDEVPDKVDFNLADDLCNERENGFLSETEDAYGMNSGIGETGNPNEESEKMMEMKSPSEPEMDREVTELPDEETEKMMETSDSSSEPQEDANHPAFAQEASESTGEERVIKTSSSDHKMEFHENVHVDGTDGTLPHENFLLHKSEAYVNFGPKDEDGNAVESKSDESWENPTEYSNESAETVDVREAPNISEHVGEKCSFEAIPKRRRWFENGETVGNVDRPSILEVDRTNSEIDPEVVEESDFAGSVEIHADKQENEASEVTAAEGSDSALNQENNRANVEATHKRRRWFVNRGGEGIVEPPSLFGGAKVGSEMESEIVDESEGFVDHMHTESRDTWNMGEADVVVNEEKRKHSVEVTPRRKRWFESVDKVGPNQQQRRDEDARTSVDVNQEHKEGDKEKSREENYDVRNDTEPVGEVHRDLDAANRRKKEKEKERLAVGRAIREARERAFAEARERARRDAAVERPKMEGIQRVGSQDRPGKASAEATSASDKASMEAKLRSERAAVERATAEARERALQKALSEKGSHRLRDPTGRHQPERSSSFDPRYHTSSSSARSLDTSNKGEKLDGTDVESAQRRKARLERQTRTMERAAKALEEKNKRDLQAQKEQAARNMMADALDVEVRRWSSGKEGNLRALLSTLQYILGSDSGWQAISLTELVAPTAVRKAYKKATLCVHPDKLQQRGATIQQKYVCEKVFDLLKEAWSKFNPDER